jgi:hypothetical protein
MECDVIDGRLGSIPLSPVAGDGSGNGSTEIAQATLIKSSDGIAAVNAFIAGAIQEKK